MNARQKLIAEIADEISCGESFGKYDAAFFLESLIDGGRVTADDVAVLLTRGQYSESHIYVADKLREIVKEDVVEFFTEGHGIRYINDRLAEERACAEEAAAERMRDDRMTGDA